MLEEEIKTMVRDKAKLLNLECKDVMLTHRKEDGKLARYGIDLQTDFWDGIIHLESSDFAELSESHASLALNQNLSGCKDEQAGIAGTLYFAFGNEFMLAHAREMYIAYTEFFASKTHIKTFGQESFDRYQMIGLKEFSEEMHLNFFAHPKPMGKSYSVFSIMKEQLKCGLMSQDPGLIMPGVSIVAASFQECFDRIDGSGLSWNERTQVFFSMVPATLMKCNVVETYKTGRFYSGPYPQMKMSESLFKKGALSQNAFKVASVVEMMMQKRYDSF
jgi:hypothetical protein